MTEEAAVAAAVKCLLQSIKEAAAEELYRRGFGFSNTLAGAPEDTHGITGSENITAKSSRWKIRHFRF